MSMSEAIEACLAVVAGAPTFYRKTRYPKHVDRSFLTENTLTESMFYRMLVDRMTVFQKTSILNYYLMEYFLPKKHYTLIESMLTENTA